MTNNPREQIADRLALHIAEQLAELSYRHIDARGREVAILALSDTVSVASAASRSPSSIIISGYLKQFGAPGTCSLIAGHGKFDAADAAFANGVSAHALDLDDGNEDILGHPSAVLVPTILALAEELDKKPADAITAYAAGIEVMVRLGRTVNPTLYSRGWHPTSTLGVFGAAAASAKLLGLDRAHTSAALALAASRASGIKANFGTMAKALHVGNAARDGIVCARLAAKGFSGSHGALDDAQGFLPLFVGPDLDVSPILAKGRPIINTVNNPIKFYGCCASTHAAVQASLNLHQQFRDAPPHLINRIAVHVDPARLPHTDRAELDTSLEGKFSMQYVVACALVDGKLSLGHFEGDSFRREEICQVMKKVDLRPDIPEGLPNCYDALVELIDCRHQVIAFARVNGEAVIGPEAGSLGNPAAWAKFDDCLSVAFSLNERTCITRAMRDFEHLQSVKTLMQHLIPGSPVRADGGVATQPMIGADHA